MQNLAKKVEVLMRFALADTEQGRAEAQSAIRSLLNSSEETVPDAEGMIRSVLLDLGVPDRIIGHRYLVTAISLAIADKKYLDNITRLLYPTIGQQHETTKVKVERAIRHAVELAFERGDTDTLFRYFGNTVSGYKGKATNSEFIARIANHICSQM